ncbi:efflux RND transporter periplasmic adaptor subunit [Opitutaceae bacterium EW11]|nr:efflux RND transporter periplasmic adaptor subunit [Opitutaceae bacterium EW11]
MLLAALVLLLLVTKALAAEQLYTCGMHPQIIKKEPGNCPICGMKLTPIRVNAGAAPVSSGARKILYYKSTMNPGETRTTPGNDSMGMAMVPVYEDNGSSASGIHIDAATIQRMNLKTAPVRSGPVERTFRAVGTVAYNEAGLQDVTTKYEGWIEKLYVGSTWTAVKAGDPLFDVYSPDLYNAQLNYLVAARSEGDAGGPLTRAALARLQLFDVPDSFIQELASTKQARRTFTFRASANGVVIEKMAVQGQMIKPGERIFRIADLSSVWVLAQIYESELPFVRPGMSATVRLSYGAPREFSANVALILPQIEEQTRTATARLVVPNPDGSLRPGMFVDVQLSAQLADSAVLVPDVAVLRSGERNTVFLAHDGGSFEPRDVTLGARTDGGFYQVLSGLTAGERVVTSGQFMLDSESQLREAIDKMMKADTASDAAPAPAMAAQPARPAPAANTTAATAASEELRQLALATTDATAALGRDDLPAYKAQLPAVRSALQVYLAADPHAAHGPLAGYTEGLPDSADLAAARRSFVGFSTAVTDLVRATRLRQADSLHAFECPMAPVVGKGRWLQRDGEIRNPFLGASMKDCGSELEDSAEAAPAPASAGHSGHSFSLPPGHPPIGETSMVDFLRAEASRQTVSAAKGSDACGGCGMSAEAMAAGEPCDHAGSAATQPPARGT